MLMTLQAESKSAELGQYLHSQRSLPGLPGQELTGQVDSAEIDRLLLEKLEEAHIYIIELNGKNKAQDEAISVLMEEIKKLKESIPPQQ